MPGGTVVTSHPTSRLSLLRGGNDVHTSACPTAGGEGRIENSGCCYSGNLIRSMCHPHFAPLWIAPFSARPLSQPDSQRRVRKAPRHASQPPFQAQHGR